MTKLQLALDSDLSTALDTLQAVHPFVDIVEIGTPLIYREGMHAVHTIHQTYPDLTLLADLKIMDAGEEEATIAFEAGAQIVTVLGVTSDATIQGAVKSARQHSGQVMVDMMQVNDLVERGVRLLKLDCDILCVHTAYDLQSSQTSPYRDLQKLRHHFPESKLAIAGGVNLERLTTITRYKPDIIVVGGAITRADDPKQAAKQIYERIHQYANT